MAGTQCTLRAINNSSNLVDMCTYQKDPDIGVPNVMSLAWFAKPAHPTTTVVFRWTIDYSFVRSETGRLIPGVFSDASQSWPADPKVVGVSSETQAGNQIGLSHEGCAHNFTKTPTAGAQAGPLYVKEDASIPLKQASAGIGMSGSVTNPTPVRFPAGLCSVTATLNEDNTRAVNPTSGLNALEHKQVVGSRRESGSAVER